MDKHTPGPWEVIGSHVFTTLGAANRAGSKACETDGWSIATVSPWACVNADGEDEDMPVSESMANAQLIASAPELLAALEDICACIMETRGPSATSALEKARAAIAKARGTD